MDDEQKARIVYRACKNGVYLNDEFGTHVNVNFDGEYLYWESRPFTQIDEDEMPVTKNYLSISGLGKTWNFERTEAQLTRRRRAEERRERQNRITDAEWKSTFGMSLSEATDYESRHNGTIAFSTDGKSKFIPAKDGVVYIDENTLRNAKTVSRKKPLNKDDLDTFDGLDF